MIRPLFLLTATTFWLVMTGLHIQREYFQLAAVNSAYEILPLANVTGLRIEYHAIYMGEERIGFSYTALEPITEGADKGMFEVRHSTYLSFLFLGQKREMLIKGRAHLDSRLFLRSYKMDIRSGGYGTAVEGQVEKDWLLVHMETENGEPVRR